MNQENKPTPAAEGHIHRFSRTERFAHWFNTMAFFALVLTGVILMLRSPLALSHAKVETLRKLHYRIGWAYGLGPFLIFLLGNPRAGYNWLCEAFKWSWSELLWLLGPLRKHLLPWTREPEVGRYNAGQRLNMFIQIIGKVVLLASGVVIYYDIGALLVYAVHLIFAFFLSAVVVGHIYMSVFHPSTRASLSGMLSGTVPHHYAARHHPAWFKKHWGGAASEKPSEKPEDKKPGPDAPGTDAPDEDSPGPQGGDS